MNETLRRALIRAGLGEEDVAAHLSVDPKTVRRWMEGRVPYLRHRWALAAMLGMDEADLWSQLRAVKTTPDEVKAIYPHLDGVPRQVWLQLFGSARHEIGILDDNALFLAEDPGILSALASRAQDGVGVRLCLASQAAREAETWCAAQADDVAPTVSVADAPPDPTTPPWPGGPIRERPVTEPSGTGQVAEIRLHRAVLYNSIYRADDEMLVNQHAYGMPAAKSPVFHLHWTPDSEMFDSYVASFERIWTMASPPA